MDEKRVRKPFEPDGLDYEVDYMSSSADYMSDIDDHVCSLLYPISNGRQNRLRTKESTLLQIS